MKKQTTKKKAAQGRGPVYEPSHLEQKITHFAREASRFLKRSWKGVAVVAAIVILGIVVHQVAKVLGEAAEADRHRELYRLTMSPDALDSSKRVDLNSVRAMIADVEGADAEAAIMKQTVEYLLERADSLASEPSTDDTKTEKSTAKERTDRRKGLLDTAEWIAQKGRERFSNDPDMQKWASYVQEKIDSNREEEKPWSDAEHRYDVILPGKVPEEASSDTSLSPKQPDSTDASPPGEAGDPPSAEKKGGRVPQTSPNDVESKKGQP